MRQKGARTPRFAFVQTIVMSHSKWPFFYYPPFNLPMCAFLLLLLFFCCFFFSFFFERTRMEWAHSNTCRACRPYAFHCFASERNWWMLSRGKFIIYSKFVFYRFFLLSFDVVDAITAVVVIVIAASVVVVTAYHVLLTGIVRARYLCSLSKWGVGKLAKHSLSQRKSVCEKF